MNGNIKFKINVRKMLRRVVFISDFMNKSFINIDIAKRKKNII